MATRYFTLDDGNNIAFHLTRADAEQVPNSVIFCQDSKFDILAKEWPAQRLTDIWNRHAGNQPFEHLDQRRFKSRKEGVYEIWWEICMPLVKRPAGFNPNTKQPQAPIRPTQELRARNLC